MNSVMSFYFFYRCTVSRHTGTRDTSFLGMGKILVISLKSGETSDKSITVMGKCLWMNICGGGISAFLFQIG